MTLEGGLRWRPNHPTSTWSYAVVVRYMSLSAFYFLSSFSDEQNERGYFWRSSFSRILPMTSWRKCDIPELIPLPRVHGILMNGVLRLLIEWNRSCLAYLRFNHLWRLVGFMIAPKSLTCFVPC